VAKFTIKPNAELDLLTQDELRTVVTETISGYLRPPSRMRVPAGVSLDGSGDGTVDAYRVEAGMRFVLTRLEVTADGYTAAVPFNPVTQGGIDIYVDGQWRDGFPIGGGTGYVLPAVYVEGHRTAIEAADGSLFTLVVGGGPASTGLTVNVCGFLSPIEPVR
jgi:hypothetical protein